MEQDKGAYEHQDRVTGVGGENAETEHRDTARGNPSDRNEIDPEERNRTDGYGPRTHDATRITRKDGPAQPAERAANREEPTQQ